MKIRRATQEDIWPSRGQYHVLTYAEEGFAPLNIHTQETSLSKEELAAFADSVNARQKVGSLYPRIPLSAIPRGAVRSNRSAKVLQGYLEEFLKENATSIGATKLLLDFRTPSVPAFVHTAVEAAVASAEALIIEELVIIEFE
jgi:hypothetical protein